MATTPSSPLLTLDISSSASAASCSTRRSNVHDLPLIADQALTSPRPLATRRRAQHDLHHMLDDLRWVIIFAVNQFPHSSSYLIDRSLGVHYRLLPLPPGSHISPERLRTSHCVYCLQKHVHHGVYATSVSPQNGREAHVGDAEVIARRENARDTEILKQMWIFVAFGLTVFLGGFAIWALDIVYCGKLRKWRRSVGLPWGIVLEGHGWW
jgi:hypothetical protein